MNTILNISNLKVYYPKRSGFFNNIAYYVKAVNDVSLTIEKGKTYGLVGESGCGKSSLGKALLGLSPITEGSVTFKDQSITELQTNNRKKLASLMQMIFQDPYSSLNPKLRISTAIIDSLKIHSPNAGKEQLQQDTAFYLEKVGLSASDMDKYPHEFSGGQRQRIAIARAIAAKPDFIICDECVSALDVSVQASILNLLLDLQQEFNLTYLFISHDLSVIKFIADTIGVMYLGEIVEEGSCSEIFNNPLHPYTRSLLSSIPGAAKNKDHTILQGDIPSPINLPNSCYFSSRCNKKFDLCTSHPDLFVKDDRIVRCQLYK